jgi:hypothetical protein
MATELVNVIMEDVLNMRSPYPTPEHEIAKGLLGKQGLGASIAGAAWEMLEPIPILGGTLRWSTERKTMYPAIVQAYGDVARLGGKTKRAISEGNLGVFKAEDLSAPLRLAGIPGVGQIEKSMRRREQGGRWIPSLLGQKIETVGKGKAKLTPAEQELVRQYLLSPDLVQKAYKNNKQLMKELLEKYKVK